MDAIVFAFMRGKAKVLLIKRSNEPFQGEWALPGGFVDMEEDLPDAVQRELQEETGLTGVELEQMYTFGNCGRDPRGRCVTIAFWGICTRDWQKIKAGDDAKEAKWFDIDDLPKMGFDHNDVIKLAVKKLKAKKIYRSKTNRGN